MHRIPLSMVQWVREASLAEIRLTFTQFLTTNTMTPLKIVQNLQNNLIAKNTV